MLMSPCTVRNKAKAAYLSEQLRCCKIGLPCHVTPSQKQKLNYILTDQFYENPKSWNCREIGLEQFHGFGFL